MYNLIFIRRLANVISTIFQAELNESKFKLQTIHLYVAGGHSYQGHWDGHLPGGG